MRKSVNRVELKGNVGGEPRITTLEDGGRVMRFSLATNELFKNRKGEPVEETTWHNVVVWEGKSTPNLEVVKRGAFLVVRGTLKQVKFVTKSGVEREGYEVLAFSVKEVGNSEV
ncbi:MAG: single-stranded DNA-binding protein [Bacteroidales bacterium]